MTSTQGVALVTGAGRGIGRAIALRLASDGFDVGLNDIPMQEATLELVAKEVAACGRRAHCVLADVSSEKEVENMVSDVVRTLGGLDVMVANAGISMMRSFVESACSGMGKQAQASLSAYSASKFGSSVDSVRCDSDHSALEFGGHRITVNSYAPGPVKTPMWCGLGIPTRVLEEQLPKGAAVGYVGEPNDIAALVSFLASKDSHLITGQSIGIDGGRYFD
ncbi:hypothetical protein BJV74DRAFT_879947 [Russula compacta]|nr:hypothetical protein BJV74DRAFT_879947 [Russula compacta]